MIKPFGINIQIEPIVIKQVAVGEVKTIGSYGKVIAIGEEVKKIKVGDIIAYRKWGLIDLIIDEEVVMFIPESDRFIVAVIHE